MSDIDFIAGLSALSGRYAGIISDVWGVLHNGLAAHPPAVEALARWRRETATPVVLLTNAPRRGEDVARQIARLGVTPEAYDAIVSSGDATRTIVAASGARTVHYIGPDRDRSLLDGLGLVFAGEDADIVVCTGPLDDDRDVPEDYRPLFERLVAAGKPFYCANPDIVVERGARLIYCAGALAALYAEIGGRTVIVGKPHAPVYGVAMDRLAALAGRRPEPGQVLAIGDAIGTDARGAVARGYDLLFITDGIHAAEFGPPGAPDPARVADRLRAEGIAPLGVMARLGW